MSNSNSYPLVMLRDENHDLIVGTVERKFLFDTHYFTVHHSGYRSYPKYSCKELLIDPDKPVHFDVYMRKVKRRNKKVFTFGERHDDYIPYGETEQEYEDDEITYDLHGTFARSFIIIII